jgi:cyanophycinase
MASLFPPRAHSMRQAIHKMSPARASLAYHSREMQPTVRAIVALMAGAKVIVGVAASEGHLVLAGGGSTPAVVFARTLELSGGRAAIVAVLPQSYPNDSIGDAAVAMWKAMGARDAFKVSLADPAVARTALKRATLILMPGGFQGLLMKALAGTPVPDEIRRRFAEGATIGGASAGAAAMSRTMIADETSPDGGGIEGPSTSEGLGLWPEAIVSPHFSERRRMNPLMAIMREHPDLIGVGIDEGTAAFVSRGELEVVGRGTVVIVEARATAARTLKPGMRVRFAPTTP